MTTKKAKKAKKAAKQDRKDDRAERRDARKEARHEKRAVRKETREDKKEARQDKRETKKEGRQEARETRQDARVEAKDIKSDANGGTKAERKDARHKARDTRQDGRQDARATKQSARRSAKAEAKEEIGTATDDKREAIAAIEDDKDEAIAATRRGWTNWLGDLKTDADRVDSPTTAAELRRIIEWAVADDVRLKPVGSGHSHSNAGQPSAGHRYVDLSRLSGLIDTEAERRHWRHSPGDAADSDETAWVRVKSGTRIQELTTQLLPPLDLGLLNMGTFDGQTLSGAVNTGTHGTGIEHGCFGDMVRSADLFVIVPDRRLRPRVELWRLEPADGPTDPAAAADLGQIDRLVQDDDLFHAMVVGFGAFGIAVSYLLAVRPYYWLKETVTQSTVAGFKEVVDRDRNGRSWLLDSRHPWAFVNIAWAQVDDPRPGDPEQLDDIPVRLVRQDETEKEEIPADFEHEIHPLWPPMRRRDGAFEAIGRDIGPRWSNSGNEAGRTAACLVDKHFIDDEERFFHREDRSAYYRVIRLTRDNTLERAKAPASKLDNSRIGGPPEPQARAMSMDMSVPVGQVGKALDTVLAECQAETIQLRIPVGIRFTAPSRHMMAASYGRASAFLEIAGTVENRKQLERDLQRYKRVLGTIGAAIRREIPAARPHLGKHHGLDHEELLRHYPQARDWLRLQGMFNTTGTWTSPFTTAFDGGRYRRSAREARDWLEGRLG